MSFGGAVPMTPRATRPRVTPPLTSNFHRQLVCPPKPTSTAAGSREGHSKIERPQMLAGEGATEGTAPYLYNPRKIPNSLIKLRARVRSLTHATKISHGKREPRNIFSPVEEPNAKMRSDFFSSDFGIFLAQWDFFVIAFWRLTPLANRVHRIAFPLRTVLRSLISPHPRSQFY